VVEQLCAAGRSAAARTPAVQQIYLPSLQRSLCACATTRLSSLSSSFSLLLFVFSEFPIFFFFFFQSELI